MKPPVMPRRPSHMLGWLCGLAVLAACAQATPTPTPTSPPTETPRPTPTDTLAPTPVPDPSIGKLMFATAEDLADAQASNLTFDAGPQAMYVAFDYADIPSDASVTIELMRDGVTLIETDTPWDKGPSGTATLFLSDDPSVLMAGAYDVTVSLAGEMLDGGFVISATEGEPGARLIVDEFEDNVVSWSERKNKNVEIEVDAGRLAVTENEAGFFYWADLPIDFEDFDLAVDARQEDGPADGYYGIVFRNSARGLYLFTVSADGYVSVGLFEGDKHTALLSDRRSNAIKRGHEVNRLRVVARGDTFAFYVNDTLISSVTDATLRRGTIGLATGNYDTPGMVSAFDNLTISLPSEEVEVVPTPTAAVTAGPRPTAAPTQPPTPPLLATVLEIRVHIDNIGGALDRLYQGGGVEACLPLLTDYYAVVDAPVYDVSGQPGNVQGAYGLYREGVAIIVDQISKIRDVCESGGGSMSPLDFDVSRIAINDASGRLGTAIGMLQTP